MEEKVATSDLEKPEGNQKKPNKLVIIIAGLLFIFLLYLAINMPGIIGSTEINCQKVYDVFIDVDGDNRIDFLHEGCVIYNGVVNFPGE